MADSNKHTVQAIEDWMNEMLECMQKGLDKGGRRGSSNNSGTLRQSLAGDHQKPVEVKGGFIKGSISMEEYGEVVDEGRKPGKRPPMSEILKWVETKLPVSDISDTSLAFLIARKIGKQGTEGTDFKSNCINKRSTKDLQERLVVAIGLDKREDIKKMLTK